MLRKQIPSSQQCSLLIQTIPGKWSQTNKDYLGKTIAKVYFIRHCNGVKMQQKFIFRIFTTVCLYNWVGLNLFKACLIFLKSLWWSVWTFCAQNLFEGTISSGAICVFPNVHLYPRNKSLWMLLWVMSQKFSPKLFKNSCSDKALQENVFDKAIF